MAKQDLKVTPLHDRVIVHLRLPKKKLPAALLFPTLLKKNPSVVLWLLQDLAKKMSRLL